MKKEEHALPDQILSILIARHLNEASEEEKERLNTFLEAHPEQLGVIHEYSRMLEELDASRKIDANTAWSVISNAALARRNQKKVQSLWRQWLPYAAVLVPLMVASLFYLFSISRSTDVRDEQVADLLSSARQPRATLVLSSGETLSLGDASRGSIFEKDGARFSQDETDQITYSEATTVSTHSLITPRAGEYRLVLPDGSSVFLNSDSRLDFPTAFTGNERRVYLSGEAYFSVATQTDRPFVVSTPCMELIVTGTSFNLSSYPEEAAITTLVKGSLSISNRQHKDIQLNAGQQAVFADESSPAEIAYVNTSHFTSWVDGLLIFHDMSLAELAKRIERWYDVEVGFADSVSPGVHFTGAMQKDKPVGYLIDLIEQTSEVSFLAKENTLQVMMTGI